MFRDFVLVTTIFFLFALSPANGDTAANSNIDILVNTLADQLWDETEVGCLRETIALLNGVKNRTLWATWAWNSMQLPAGTFYGSKYHLGNFEQCLKTPWSRPGLQMQYCLLDVKMTGLKKYAGTVDPYHHADSFIEMESMYGSRYNTLSLGVCLPATCKPGSVGKISRLLYQESHLPFEDLLLDPRDCQVAGQSMVFGTEFYVLLYLILFMTSVCLLVYFRAEVRDETIVSKVLRCFCLTRNFNALTEIQTSEVRCVHGMRAFTSGTLIVSHYFMIIHHFLVNYMDSEKLFSSKYGSMLLLLDACVDTFFVMSGILWFKGLVSSSSPSIFKILFKRYLRLLTPFAVALLSISFVLPHLGSGPVWPKLSRQVLQPCADTWWRNLMMMGNMYDGKVCMEVSWYIHCDYQLTVLCTLVFMLYRKCKPSTKKAATVFCAVYLLSAVIPASLIYWQELPRVLFYNFGESREIINNKLYKAVYTKSHSRAGPYIIGSVLGYFLTVYKPDDYRKVMSKTCSIIGGILSISLMVLVLKIGSDLLNNQHSEVISAVLASLDRSIWAIAICLLIIVCEYGTLPIVNDLLSSKVFVPLSKLSYCNYMLHTLFINRHLMSLRAPLHFDFYTVTIHGLGYIVITCCTSYLFWLFVEAPVSNLINVLFENRTKKGSHNTTKKNEDLHTYKNGKIL